MKLLHLPRIVQKCNRFLRQPYTAYSIRRRPFPDPAIRIAVPQTWVHTVSNEQCKNAIQTSLDNEPFRMTVQAIVVCGAYGASHRFPAGTSAGDVIEHFAAALGFSTLNLYEVEAEVIRQVENDPSLQEAAVTVKIKWSWTAQLTKARSFFIGVGRPRCDASTLALTTVLAAPEAVRLPTAATAVAAAAPLPTPATYQQLAYHYISHTLPRTCGWAVVWVEGLIQNPSDASGMDWEIRVLVSYIQPTAPGSFKPLWADGRDYLVYGGHLVFNRPPLRCRRRLSARFDRDSPAAEYAGVFMDSRDVGWAARLEARLKDMVEHACKAARDTTSSPGPTPSPSLVLDVVGVAGLVGTFSAEEAVRWTVGRPDARPSYPYVGALYDAGRLIFIRVPDHQPPSALAPAAGTIPDDAIPETVYMGPEQDGDAAAPAAAVKPAPVAAAAAAGGVVKRHNRHRNRDRHGGSRAAARVGQGNSAVPQAVGAAGKG